MRSRIAGLVAAQFEDNTRNLIAYRPDLAPGPRIVLLRSEDGYSTVGMGCVPHEWLENRADAELATRGWEEITGAKVPVVPIPGNHFEPFERDNVSTLLLIGRGIITKLMMIAGCGGIGGNFRGVSDAGGVVYCVGGIWGGDFLGGLDTAIRLGIFSGWDFFSGSVWVRWRDCSIVVFIPLVSLFLRCELI